MFKTGTKIYILLIACLLFVPGCSFKVKQYRQKTVTPLNPQINFKTTEQDIDLRAKKFTPIDCFRLFGERGKKLITRNKKTSIYPIQLAFTNYSDKTYVLSKENIDMRIMKYQHVAHRMQHSTALRSVGLLFSGALLATLVAVGGIAAVIIGMATAFAPIAIIGAAACTSAPFMLVIGTPVSTTVNGIHSLRTNTFIKKDVKEKSLVHRVIIKPEENIDTIIFVKGKFYKDEFSITLYNQDNVEDMVIFNVPL